MASAYPGAVDSFTTRSNGQVIDASHINDLQAAVVATQTEMGTDPAGSAATIKARLAVSLADDGDLAFTGVSTLTISGGVITVTGNRHLVDTESAAAADNLDTINGGAAGAIVILRTAADARNVTLTNAGNISTPGGISLLLDYANQICILVYDGALSKWLTILPPLPRLAISAQTGTYSALVTDEWITADGTFTITLPAVADALGVRLDITNIGTGVITVDGTGAETISGAANYVMNIQYQSVTLACNGSAWYIL